MKQHKLISVSVVLALLIAGQASALEQQCEVTKSSSPEQITAYHVIENEPAAALTEITLQHDFVAQFNHFDEFRFMALKTMVRNDAQRLTEGMRATVIARNDAEASLVTDTYRRNGATAVFDRAIDPDAKIVTIKIVNNNLSR